LIERTSRQMVFATRPYIPNQKHRREFVSRHRISTACSCWQTPASGPFRVAAGVCERRYCPISRVHLLNFADGHDVDLGFVSSETEYFIRGRVPRAATFDVVIGCARGRVHAAAHALAARRAIPVLQFVSAAKVSVAARPKPVANGRRSSSRTSHCGRRQATKGIARADARG
jgi:hypothetical protein